MNTLRHDTGSPPGPPGLDDGVQELLACLAPGAVPRALHDFLAARIEADGLADFVEQRLAAFNRAVGVAWVGGGLGSHAEHHYSSAVQAVVQRHLQMCEPRPFRSRVVLTTPPGELHGLGLLAVQAALTLQGAECFNLGLQTPVSEVVQVVKDRAITLVAISASIVLPPGVAGALLNTVYGLLVAIPAMFAYNFQVTTIRGLTNELDNFVAELEVAFGHRYGDNRAIAEEISDAVETRFIRLQDAVNAQKQLITASKP